MVSPIDGMVMVYVPAGEFRMGSGSHWSEVLDDQVHTIYLDEYWIDQTEVTNAMYAKCVAAGACTEPGLPSSKTRSSYYGDSSYEDYPVIYVNWNQANSYCQWADRDLPTEAQWEKSARAEDQRMYPWGNNSPSESLVNYGFLVGDTAEVGSYPEGSSPYGVLDMAGNVEEWVADWYDSIYYSRSPKNNPTGPASGEYRVVRGGGWSSDSRLYSYINPKISSVDRSGVRPDYDSDNLGFRCSYSP